MELHLLADYSFEAIESLILNEVEESIHVEFKSGEALSKSDSMKKEISKDVAAFANSDGGVIFYGINESEHKASSFSFIDGSVITKEWLEQVISSTIQRNIPDLRIFPVRRNGVLAETVYVVQIPVSTEAPHLSKDKRYYKRYNFESVPMEEYEIRQLYGRRVKSKLEILSYYISEVKSDNTDKKKFLCEVSVINDGEKIEENYKINVYFINFHKLIDITWDETGPNKNINYTIIEKGKVKISAAGIVPIYPSETVNVIRFFFEMPILNMKEILSDVLLEFVLFYPSGEDKMEVELNKLMDKVQK
jgi:hypothetical protein